MSGIRNVGTSRGVESVTEEKGGTGMRLKISASLLAAVFAFAITANAQQTQKQAPTDKQGAPSITFDQLLEKNIQATGGREAAEKMTSLVMSGSMDILAMGATATTETSAKAPDKRVSMTNVDGFGEIDEGYDGKTAWHQDPQGGFNELTGDRLAGVKLDAQFNGDLKLKQLYSKTEVTGREQVNGRDCWVVKLTPAQGSPITRYYDAETFLLAKSVSVSDTPNGMAEVAVEYSGYSDIGNGRKMAHKMKINVPGIGDIAITYKDIKYNVAIDDAKFAPPKH